MSGRACPSDKSSYRSREANASAFCYFDQPGVTIRSTISMDDDSTETSHISQTSSKRFALLSIAGVFLVFYFVEWFAGNPEARFQLIDFAFAIFFTIAVFFWCQLDARERGISVGTGFGIALLILSPVALMYYFFRSRGFKGGLVAIGWMLLFALGIIIASSIEVIILSLFSDRLGFFKDFSSLN